MKNTSGIVLRTEEATQTPAGDKKIPTTDGSKGYRWRGT